MISERVELARRASPICHVRKGAPPFLIVHGDKDELVPVQQSEIFHAALPGAPHGGPALSAPENLKALLELFARHLGSERRSPEIIHPRSPSLTDRISRTS
jgi:acetyl esterase/lipase